MMTITRRAVCCLLLLVICAAAFGRGPQNEQSAPELLIKSARFLEENPLDKKAKDVRSWAIKWLIVTDKVSVTICADLIAKIDKKYKYESELFGQYSIGMGAFKLANPDKAKDEEATQLAGIESAVIAYQAIVKAQPKATSAFMDQLVAKRSDGSLAKFVAENNCKGKK